MVKTYDDKKELVCSSYIGRVVDIIILTSDERVVKYIEIDRICTHVLGHNEVADIDATQECMQIYKLRSTIPS